MRNTGKMGIWKVIRLLNIQKEKFNFLKKTNSEANK